MPRFRSFLVPLLATLLVAACGGEQYSMLMQAARFGDTQAIWKYAAEGFNVNEKTREGKTPLILAATAGHVATVEALIDVGADVHLQDNTGATALIAAATAGHAEVVRILLARGANAAAKDRDGGSAILNAVFFGYRDAVTELLKFKQHIDPADLAEAMLIAAGMGHTDIVRDLIRNQVSVNVTGLHKRTPLMAAVKFGRAETVRLLLENGSDLAARDEDGNDVMALAQDQGDDAIVDMLRQAAEPKPVDPPVAEPPAVAN